MATNLRNLAQELIANPTQNPNRQAESILAKALNTRKVTFDTFYHGAGFLKKMGLLG